MKHNIYTVFAVLLFLVAQSVQAENVPIAKAQDAAAHYMQHNTKFESLLPSQLKLVHQWTNEVTGEATMYLFTTPGTGWILMSAETAMDPVLGFSDDSYISLNNMAGGLKWWIGKYHELISELQEYAENNRVVDNPEWADLFDHKLTGNSKDQNIVLMQERWDQGNVKGTDYNMYSPVINDTVCPAGCVATALAQMCHYYQFPKQGQGWSNYTTSTYKLKISVHYNDSAVFNYDSMPNKVNVYSTPISQRRELSRLHYYVGTAVKMDYGPDGSGAFSQNVPSAMANRFKYQLGTISYRSNSVDSIWISKLRNSLLNKNILYMSGSSSTGSDAHAAGHAWLCAGYREQNTKMYYMNWGWDGSGNGFFNLVDNIMSISGFGYNFNKGQAYIIDMVPPADSLLAVTDVEPQSQLGKAYPNPSNYSVTIPFSSRESSVLTVYSVDGREVISQRLGAGDGEVVLRVDAMPSGVYIYRLGNNYGKFVVR